MATTQKDIEHELLGMLERFVDPATQLTADSDFSSDLALESIQLMEFMVDIEDHYDIAVDLDSLSRIKTINELAAVVTDLVDES